MSGRARRIGVGFGLALVIGSVSAYSWAQPEPPRKPDPLAKQRAEIAKNVYERLLEELKNPPAGDIALEQTKLNRWIERMADWSNRWMEAEAQAAERKADEIRAIESHIARMKSWEDQFREVARGDAVELDPTVLDMLTYDRLEAESLLARVKGE